MDGTENRKGDFSRSAKNAMQAPCTCWKAPSRKPQGDSNPKRL